MRKLTYALGFILLLTSCGQHLEEALNQDQDVQNGIIRTYIRPQLKTPLSVSEKKQITSLCEAINEKDAFLRSILQGMNYSSLWSQSVLDCQEISSQREINSSFEVLPDSIKLTNLDQDMNEVYSKDAYLMKTLCDDVSQTTQRMREVSSVKIWFELVSDNSRICSSNKICLKVTYTETKNNNDAVISERLIHFSMERLGGKYGLKVYEAFSRPCDLSSANSQVRRALVKELALKSITIE